MNNCVGCFHRSEVLLKHMSDKTNEEQLKVLQITELRRIADSLEEVIKMVKLDQEASKKRWEYKPEEKDDE